MWQARQISVHSPCAETFHYTKYYSNATHAFSPIKMILDVYNLPSEVVEVAESPCCQGACEIASEEGTTAAQKLRQVKSTVASAA